MNTGRLLFWWCSVLLLLLVVGAQVVHLFWFTNNLSNDEHLHHYYHHHHHHVEHPNTHQHDTRQALETKAQFATIISQANGKMADTVPIRETPITTPVPAKTTANTTTTVPPQSKIARQPSEMSSSTAVVPHHEHHLIISPQQLLANANSKAKLWGPSMTSVPLPQWLQDYFTWHQEQRQTMHRKSHHRYLIMYAKRGVQAGGFTDRIRPFPIMLRMAALTHRVLLIQWEKPFALEEFLVPTPGGCNWTVPNYLLNHRGELPQPMFLVRRIWIAVQDPKRKIITSTYQSASYGENFYKQLMKEKQQQELEAAKTVNDTEVAVTTAANSSHTIPYELDLLELFRDLWKIMFQPSPPVARLIQQNLRQMQLVPGEFASVHLRVLYAVDAQPLYRIHLLVKNAMNCVSNLRPGGPYFVAGDSLDAIRMAHDYAVQHNVTLHSASHDTTTTTTTTMLNNNNNNNNRTKKEPQHLEWYNASDTSLMPSDFYAGFVDVYLMAATRCVAAGKGGFAKWGQLLGYNSSCIKIHDGTGADRNCRWTD